MMVPVRFRRRRARDRRRRSVRRRAGASRAACQLVTRHRAGVAAHLFRCRSGWASARSSRRAARDVVTPLGASTPKLLIRWSSALLKYGIDLLLVAAARRTGRVLGRQRSGAAIQSATMAELVQLAGAPGSPRPFRSRSRAIAVCPARANRRGGTDAARGRRRARRPRGVSPIVRGGASRCCRTTAATISCSRTITRSSACLRAGRHAARARRRNVCDHVRAGVQRAFSVLDPRRFARQPDAERDRPSAKAGMRSALRAAPVRGRVGGTLEFCSSAWRPTRKPTYAVARRIADYVDAGDRAISGWPKTHGAPRARARDPTNLLMLDELLATLAGVLDVREVFDRVSAIAQKVLPHDAMAVAEVLERRHARPGPRQLSGSRRFPGPFDYAAARAGAVDRPLGLPDHRRHVRSDPRYASSPTVEAGMRSVLACRCARRPPASAASTSIRGRQAASPATTCSSARRIADHVALALSHQRLAEQARRNEELRARTANLELLDELLAALTDTRRTAARCSSASRRSRARCCRTMRWRCR